MKLHYSPASPYARKVCVVAIETGLDAKIERIVANTSPTKPDPTLGKDNPLFKVPALVTDGGEAIYDSSVICEYLDSLHGGMKLIPPSGGARWRALRLQSLGDGMLDAGILIRYETVLRPAEKRWDDWISGQSTKVNTGLDSLEQDVDELEGPLDIGQIAIACAIGWLEFRKPAGEMRPRRPKLFGWYDAFAKRPSMVATVPKA
jgi:glutathione S-transferase